MDRTLLKSIAQACGDLTECEDLLEEISEDVSDALDSAVGTAADELKALRQALTEAMDHLDRSVTILESLTDD